MILKKCSIFKIGTFNVYGNMYCGDEGKPKQKPRFEASGNGRNKNMDIVVSNATMEESVLSKLDELMEGKSNKDAANVIQAAILAGAIIRPSYSQFCNRYGLDVISKALYNRYVGLDKKAFLEAELTAYTTVFSQMNS